MLKKWFVLGIAIAMASILVACTESAEPSWEAEPAPNYGGKPGIGNVENPLYGIIFNDIFNVQELKIAHSSVVNYYALPCFEFGFTFFDDIYGNTIFVLSEFLEFDANGREVRKILDTLNLGRLNENENFDFFAFYRDEAIDLFESIDRELVGVLAFGEIDRVWRADRNTGRFSQIDITGLRYRYNFGADLQPGDYDEGVRYASEIIPFDLSRELPVIKQEVAAFCGNFHNEVSWDNVRVLFSLSYPGGGEMPPTTMYFLSNSVMVLYESFFVKYAGEGRVNLYFQYFLKGNQLEIIHSDSRADFLFDSVPLIYESQPNRRVLSIDKNRKSIIFDFSNYVIDFYGWGFFLD